MKLRVLGICYGAEIMLLTFGGWSYKTDLSKVLIESILKNEPNY